MIPKTLHYCWFGNKPKSELIKYCIESWVRYLPDYQMIEWNESNFNLEINSYAYEAYLNKKWAFVSDYVRAYALYHHGGIYLDTDVEIKQNLDSFLIHGAFSGFERIGFPFTALWGSEKEHYWPKKVLEFYNQKYNFEQITNTIIVTKILIDEFKVNPNKDEFQELEFNIAIYPSTHFCIDLAPNFASHHFLGSWGDEDTSYKDNIHKIYYLKKYLKEIEGQNVLEKLFQNEIFSAKELFEFSIKIFKKRFNQKYNRLFRK